MGPTPYQELALWLWMLSEARAITRFQEQTAILPDNLTTESIPFPRLDTKETSSPVSVAATVTAAIRFRWEPLL